MAFLGNLSHRQPRPRPAISPASTPTSARRRRAGPTLFDTWCAARATAALEASPAGGRRLPRRARRAVEAGHGPERGGRDRRRLPRGRASGPDEDPARRRRAPRHRPPARRAATRRNPVRRRHPGHRPDLSDTEYLVWEASGGDPAAVRRYRELEDAGDR